MHRIFFGNTNLQFRITIKNYRFLSYQMKHFFIIGHIVLLSAFSFAQAQPTRSQQLNQSVAALYQSGKYDEAIPVAEEIVGLERKEAATKNLVNALENLAQIRVTRFKKLVADLNAGTMDAAAAKAAVTRLRSDAERAEENLREAIKLTDAASATADQRTALLNSLAWLLYSYQPPDPEVSIAFDKSARDKFEMRAKARYYKRINEAESVYQEALRSAAGNDNASLLTTFNFAEFALATGDLENALARLEKCIADVERIHGKTSRNLVEPLDRYIRALAATGQDDAAFEIVSRLVRVTGKSAGMPKTLLNISLRSDKAFAPTNASGVESNARANRERETLAGRQATITSSIDAMLAVSTHGKQYYDAGLPVNINKVPVKVLIDENGKVVEAEAFASDKETKSDAETAVKEWKFKPFVTGGVARKVRGYVECIILANRTAR